MSLNTTTAIPYFYAAGVQVITAVSAQLASSYTKTSFNALLAQTMSYQPLRNGGIIPEGTPRGTLIPEELSPATILKRASRDRDIATIFTGVVFVIAPIALTASDSQVRSQVVILALVLVGLLLAFGTWWFRKRLAARKTRPGVLITNVAVGILVAVNVLAGCYFLFKAPAVANCPVPPSISPVPSTSTP